jgi:hypothetical protein
MNWLFDHRTTVSLLAGTAAIVLLFSWFNTKKRLLIQAAAVVVSLLSLFLAVGLVYKTPTQKVTRAIQAMAENVSIRNVPGVLEYVSDEFAYSSHNKATLRTFVDSAVQGEGIEELKVWDFERAQFPRPAPGDKETGTISFKFKVRGPTYSTEPYWHCNATFVKDPDGQWRLLTFQVFPFNSKDEYRVP